MPRTANTENEQVYWIAKIFYRIKGRALPGYFGPRHKLWIHFRRARLWMIGLDALEEGKYKTFLKAQFEYAPGSDPAQVWPNMLYSHRATRNWKWYLDKKARRLGGIIPGILDYEKSLSTNRTQSLFEQNAWDLEGYVRSGFTVHEAFHVFWSIFEPGFILASPGAAAQFEKDQDYFGPLVKELYPMVKGRTKALHKMRTLYGKCREQQQERWGKRLLVRRFQLEDVHPGSTDPEEDPGAVGPGSEVPDEA